MYFIVTDSEDVANLAKKSGAQIMELKPEQIIPPTMREISYIPRNVTDFLFSIGIHPHLKGFHYIKYILENPLEINVSITKVLYPNVAKHFGDTPSKVERGIRHAIQQSFDSKNYRQEYIKLFGAIDIAPTNMQFLTACKVYLKDFFNI